MRLKVTLAALLDLSSRLLGLDERRGRSLRARGSGCVILGSSDWGKDGKEGREVRDMGGYEEGRGVQSEEREGVCGKSKLSSIPRGR